MGPFYYYCFDRRHSSYFGICSLSWNYQASRRALNTLTNPSPLWLVGSKRSETFSSKLKTARETLRSQKPERIEKLFTETHHERPGKRVNECKESVPYGKSPEPGLAFGMKLSMNSELLLTTRRRGFNRNTRLPQPDFSGHLYLLPTKLHIPCFSHSPSSSSNFHFSQE